MRDELCPLLSGIVADPPLHWVEGGVHRVAVYLGGKERMRVKEEQKRRWERLG